MGDSLFKKGKKVNWGVDGNFSASEVTTLRRFTNMLIIIIIIMNSKQWRISHEKNLRAVLIQRERYSFYAWPRVWSVFYMIRFPVFVSCVIIFYYIIYC